MRRSIALIAALAMLALAPMARADITILGGKYLVAAGDIACAPSSSAPDNTHCREGETAALFGSGVLHTSNLTGIVALGDEQYDTGQLADFNNRSFACTTQQCSYDKSWGDASAANSSAILNPTPGDHDYQDTVDGTGCRLNSGGSTPNACGLNGYFGNTTAAPSNNSTGRAGDSAGDYWQVFDAAASHPLLLVVVNSGQCFVINTACANGGSAVTWLTNTLADTTINPAKDCTIIVTADTRWSYYDHGDDAHIGSKLWQAAFSPSAHGQWPDLWLSSHDHVYENYETGIDVSGNKNTGSYDPAGNYLRETVVGMGGHDATQVDTGPGSTAGQPTYVDNTNVVGGVHYGNFGDLQLVYDSTNGALRSEFFKAYPGTGGVDDTGTWTCRT